MLLGKELNAKLGYLKGKAAEPLFASIKSPLLFLLLRGLLFVVALLILDHLNEASIKDERGRWCR